MHFCVFAQVHGVQNWQKYHIKNHIKHACCVCTFCICCKKYKFYKTWLLSTVMQTDKKWLIK